MTDNQKWNPEICRTMKLSWETVSLLLGKMMKDILGRTVVCDANPDAADYWSTGFVGSRMPMSDLYRLMEKLHLSRDARAESLPDTGDNVDSVDCIGMAISEALLKQALPFGWKEAFWNNDFIWLVESEAREYEHKINVGNQEISLASLKSKAELISCLTKNGATHEQLMNFCEDYREKYHNELCWAFPISDGKHLGTFIVLVREGALSLPYDEADAVDGEIFCLDDIRMFCADDMADFIESWQLFDSELQRAMESLLLYLKNKEAQNANSD